MEDQDFSKPNSVSKSHASLVKHHERRMSPGVTNAFSDGSNSFSPQSQHRRSVLGAIKQMTGDKSEPGDENSLSRHNSLISLSSPSQNNQKSPQEEKQQNSFTQRILSALDSKYFNLIILISTIYTLFVLDACRLLLSTDADWVLDIITSMIFFLFLSEVIINSFLKPKFVLSFLFWMDIAGTISLIPDIYWIMNLFVNQETSVRTNTSDNFVSQAGDISRAGARASRLFRLIRLVRLVRIIRFFNVAKQGDLNEEDRRPCKVGQRLSELMAQRAVLGIMILAISLPMLDFITVDNSYKVGVSMINHAATRNQSLSDYDEVLENSVRSFQLVVPNILLLEVGEKAFVNKDATDIAPADILVSQEGEVLALFSIEEENREKMIFGLLTTLLIVVMFAIAAFFINYDTQTLVVGPIERMTDVVKQLARTVAILSSNKSGGTGPNKDPDEAYVDEEQFIENALKKVTQFFNEGLSTSGLNRFRNSTRRNSQTFTKTHAVGGSGTNGRGSSKRITPVRQSISQTGELMNVLEDDKMVSILKAYMTKEWSVENLFFWQEVGVFNKESQKVCNDMVAWVHDILDDFISSGGTTQVNLPDQIVDEVNKQIKKLQTHSDAFVNIFRESQSEIYRLMERDTFSRFKETKEYKKWKDSGYTPLTMHSIDDTE